jgi:glycosyltransferase involved in cell wall biosynthesis
VPKQKHILIITQPDYPVPPVCDGAQSIVIYDTVKNIGTKGIATISLWNKKLEGTVFDQNTFHIVRNDRLLFRMIRKVVVKIKKMKFLQSIRYADMIVGIYLYSLRNPVSTLVVHSTKMNWLLELKRWFPHLTIVSYHHSSEDQNCDTDVFRMVVDRIDAHIFVSKYGQQVFEEKAGIVSPGKKLKTRVIQNGVDLQIFKPTPERRKELQTKFNLSADKVTLLFVGRIIPRKGLHVLLEALQLFPADVLGKVQLLIAGGSDFFKQDGTPYIIEIKKAISLLRERMAILESGYIPHSEVNELFKVADVFVFTSIEPEGSPLSVIEASACGLPSVVSGVGGINESIQHEKTGLVLDFPLQTSQLSEYLIRLIANPLLRATLGNNAREYAERQLSSERMAVDFFQEISGVKINEDL